MSYSLTHGHAGPRSYVTYRRLLYEGGHPIAQLVIHEPSGGVPEIREEVIQDIWHRQEFETEDLTTTTGERITVIDPGSPNVDSGPDFRQARVEIDELQWFGDIEIHRTPSGWYEHGHDRDPRYNRVVLHVSLHVTETSDRLRREDRSILPELVLEPYLSTPVRRLLYQFYNRSSQTVYCASSWKQVPASLRLGWIRRLGLERLQAHKQQLAADYMVHGDLHLVLYRHLFRALGYAKNDRAMLSLVDRVPFEVAHDYRDAPVALEALFLGMAGLLSGGATPNAFEDETARYIEDLRGYFEEMFERIDRPPMDPTAWQFFRLRPANFPTLRIVQGAALLQRDRLLQGDSIGLLTEAVEADNPVGALRSLLRVELTGFWTDHIRLEQRTKPRNPTLGKTRADTIAVNVLLPTVLLYAEQQEDVALMDRVTEAYRRFPAGSDRIVRRFEAMGTTPTNAQETQGIHQLYRTRCSKARCLECAIGRYVLEHG